MTELNDDVLTAYADGELDRDTAAQVRAALAADPAAAETVRRFMEVTRRAQQAFAEPLHGEVPARLLQAVGAATEDANQVVDLAARRAARPGFSVRRVALPVAASLMLLIGGLVGYQLKPTPGADQATGATTAQVAANLTGDISRSSALHDVLESTASGLPVGWTEQASGLRVEAVARLTFQTADGGYCREYQVSVDDAGSRQGAAGVACRSAAGAWRTEILVASEAGSGGSGTYVPASGGGVEALDRYLAETMAAPALDREAESSLLQSGWQ